MKGNKLFQQQINSSITWLFLYVHVKHVKVSAVKNKYYIKNTAAVYICIYIVT
jgi:hypothetical protein